jgi:hypothetical protein
MPPVSGDCPLPSMSDELAKFDDGLYATERFAATKAIVHKSLCKEGRARRRSPFPSTSSEGMMGGLRDPVNPLGSAYSAL